MISWALRSWPAEIEKSDWGPGIPVGCNWTSDGGLAAYASSPGPTTTIGTTTALSMPNAPATQMAFTLGEAALKAVTDVRVAWPTSATRGPATALMVSSAGRTASQALDV